jgi:hypothetical protein
MSGKFKKVFDRLMGLDFDADLEDPRFVDVLAFLPDPSSGFASFGSKDFFGMVIVPSKI